MIINQFIMAHHTLTWMEELAQLVLASEVGSVLQRKGIYEKSGYSQAWGTQKGCPHLNFSKCECVKQVHCLNKIKYDFTKCTFNLLHL
jgi:hypothetical protein